MTQLILQRRAAAGTLLRGGAGRCRAGCVTQLILQRRAAAGALLRRGAGRFRTGIMAQLSLQRIAAAGALLRRGTGRCRTGCMAQRSLQRTAAAGALLRRGTGRCRAVHMTKGLLQGRAAARTGALLRSRTGGLCARLVAQRTFEFNIAAGAALIGRTGGRLTGRMAQGREVRAVLRTANLAACRSGTGRIQHVVAIRREFDELLAHLAAKLTDLHPGALAHTGGRPDQFLLPLMLAAAGHREVQILAGFKGIAVLGGFNVGLGIHADVVQAVHARAQGQAHVGAIPLHQILEGDLFQLVQILVGRKLQFNRLIDRFLAGVDDAQAGLFFLFQLLGSTVDGHLVLLLTGDGLGVHAADLGGRQLQLFLVQLVDKLAFQLLLHIGNVANALVGNPGQQELLHRLLLIRLQGHVGIAGHRHGHLDAVIRSGVEGVVAVGELQPLDGGQGHHIRQRIDGGLHHNGIRRIGGLGGEQDFRHGEHQLRQGNHHVAAHHAGVPEDQRLAADRDVLKGHIPQGEVGILRNQLAEDMGQFRLLHIAAADHRGIRAHLVGPQAAVAEDLCLHLIPVQLGQLAAFVNGEFRRDRIGLTIRRHEGVVGQDRQLILAPAGIEGGVPIRGEQLGQHVQAFVVQLGVGQHRLDEDAAVQLLGGHLHGIQRDLEIRQGIRFRAHQIEAVLVHHGQLVQRAVLADAVIGIVDGIEAGSGHLQHFHADRVGAGPLLRLLKQVEPIQAQRLEGLAARIGDGFIGDLAVHGGEGNLFHAGQDAGLAQLLFPAQDESIIAAGQLQGDVLIDAGKIKLGAGFLAAQPDQIQMINILIIRQAGDRHPIQLQAGSVRDGIGGIAVLVHLPELGIHLQVPGVHAGGQGGHSGRRRFSCGNFRGNHGDFRHNRGCGHLGSRGRSGSIRGDDFLGGGRGFRRDGGLGGIRCDGRFGGFRRDGGLCVLRRDGRVRSVSQHGNVRHRCSGSRFGDHHGRLGHGRGGGLLHLRGQGRCGSLGRHGLFHRRCNHGQHNNAAGHKHQQHRQNRREHLFLLACAGVAHPVEGPLLGQGIDHQRIDGHLRLAHFIAEQNRLIQQHIRLLLQLRLLSGDIHTVSRVVPEEGLGQRQHLLAIVSLITAHGHLELRLIALGRHHALDALDNHRRIKLGDNHPLLHLLIPGRIGDRLAADAQGIAQHIAIGQHRSRRQRIRGHHRCARLITAAGAHSSIPFIHAIGTSVHQDSSPIGTHGPNNRKITKLIHKHFAANRQIPSPARIRPTYGCGSGMFTFGSDIWHQTQTPST